MDPLPLFRTFVRVVEAQSFSAVARELRTTQPTISRQVAALERHLGCALLRRTTRRLALTEDGRVFHEQARRALEAVAEAEAAVGSRRARPGGRLRLACAEVLGRLHILPRLGRFLDAHPEMEVELLLSDATTDLVAEGVDLAVRVGLLEESGLVARRIGLTRRVVVAAPDYLARRGTPARPQELGRHDCVIYTRLGTGASWPFDGPEGAVSVPVRGRLGVSSTEAVRAAVLAGHGIGMVPIWHFVEDEIATGKLTRLLRGWEPPPFPIHAVHAGGRFVPPKVRAMNDFLAAEFARDPLLNGKGWR
jgi:DNA-binding transcriptional LysR family regulator